MFRVVALTPKKKVLGTCLFFLVGEEMFKNQQQERETVDKNLVTMDMLLFPEQISYPESI